MAMEGNWTLGEVVNEAFTHAIDRWTVDHARGRDPEVFKTSDLIAVTFTFSIGRRRQDFIWVEVTARKPFDHATYGYRVLHDGPGNFAPGLKPVT
jgi:hypothetical protein